MVKPTQTPEVTNYESLNKFLLGTLAQIKRKEIAIEEAEAISKISDKIIKNNLTKILDAKRMKDDTPIDFFLSHERKVFMLDTEQKAAK